MNMLKAGRRAGAAVALAVAALSATAQADLPLSEILRQTHVHGLALDPDAPDRLLLATHHGLWVVDLERVHGSLVGTSQDDFMGFTSHPAQPGTYFASGHPAQGGNLGVILSQDGGESWRQIATGVGGPVDFHQMEISRADPQTLFGVHHGTSLQRSDDGGVTWREVGIAPAGIIDLAASANAVDGLYAATRSGLLFSEDGGQNWIPAHPADAPVSFVDVAVNGTLHAFVLGMGLLQRDEGNPEWRILNDSFGEDYILHFARDPMAASRAFAATASGALIASQDGGTTWKIIAEP